MRRIDRSRAVCSVMPVELRQEDVAHQLLRDRAAAGQIRRAVPRDVREDARRPCRSDRRRDARRTGDPRSRARPGPCAAGSPTSATGRRFSRSPLTSAVSSGASSVEPFAGVRCRARAARRGPACAAAASAAPSLARRRRPLKDDADDLALELARLRGTIDDRAAVDGELAGLLERRALRVAEVVQPIDELPLGQRLAAPQLERPREDARQDAVALAVQARVDQARERRRSSSRRRDAAATSGTAIDDRRDQRTQRRRQSAATRTVQPSTARSAGRGFTLSSDRDNPVVPEVERQLLDRADRRAPGRTGSGTRRSRSSRSCAWPSGKASAARADELAAQRLVAPLGRLNHLAVQRLRGRAASGRASSAPRLRASDRAPASPATTRAICASMACARLGERLFDDRRNLRLRAARSAPLRPAPAALRAAARTSSGTAAPPNRRASPIARGYISGIGTPKCS